MFKETTPFISFTDHSTHQKMTIVVGNKFNSLFEKWEELVLYSCEFDQRVHIVLKSLFQMLDEVGAVYDYYHIFSLSYYFLLSLEILPQIQD